MDVLKVGDLVTIAQNTNGIVYQIKEIRLSAVLLFKSEAREVWFSKSAVRLYTGPKINVPDLPPPLKTSNPAKPKDGGSTSLHEHHDIVKASAGGDAFLYCRDCKVEVKKPNTLLDPEGKPAVCWFS